MALDERNECKPDRAQPVRDERSECKPDRAQPSRNATTPTKIKKLGPGELQILWADGHETRHLAPLLRGLCPCASCQDEMTGKRVVLPIHIPDTIEFKKIELVGQYAVHFEFSDTHHTGIYSFEYLRHLCRCPECAK